MLSTVFEDRQQTCFVTHSTQSSMKDVVWSCSSSTQGGVGRPTLEEVIYTCGYELTLTTVDMIPA